MFRRIFYFLIRIFFFLFFSFSVQAWNHGISLGYGNAEDINNSSDTNAGFLLSGDLFPLFDWNWLNCMLNASVGNWQSSVSRHDNLTTGALSLAFRGYLTSVHGPGMNPYLLAAAGPSILSTRIFGQNVQGANVAFQLSAGAGIEFLNNNNHGFDINARFVHFSNADLFLPNEGFNFLYLISVGYLF